MSNKIKSNARKITLTASYVEITAHTTTPFFKGIQVVNSTGHNITYVVNPQNDPPDASEEITLQDGDIFYLDSSEILHPREDTILMKGSGDIVVEMDVYQPLEL